PGPPRPSSSVREAPMEGRDMADLEMPDGLRDDLRAAWHRYVDLLAPLRPTLHGYCSRLTGNLWDAEDLVQDTLLRAFGTLGSIFTRIENPRAYLLRTATNLWIDTVRRRGNEATALAEQAPLATSIDAEAAGAVRDAGTVLLQRLAPQERAAVVLKELFDYRLEEIAEVLATTVPGRAARARVLHTPRARSPRAGTPVRGAGRTDRPAPRLRVLSRNDAGHRRGARSEGADRSLPLPDAGAREAVGGRHTRDH